MTRASYNLLKTHLFERLLALMDDWGVRSEGLALCSPVLYLVRAFFLPSSPLDVFDVALGPLFIKGKFLAY
jgi:hypothetical protein